MEQFYAEHNYPSAKVFYQILKENGKNYTMKEVKEFVQHQSVIQLHKPVRQLKRKKRFIVASSPYEIFQIDLIDYKKFSHKNKGYKYILICVDVFTRQAFTIPIFYKTAENCGEALNLILKLHTPKVIYTDDGKEWKGDFSEAINNNNILHIIADFGDHRILGIIDRFTQTIKKMISKYMTANETTKWIDILPKITKLYNNTPHSALAKLKPSEVLSTPENELIVGTINYEKQKINNGILAEEKNPIEIGDLVRVERIKGTFEKGYEKNYTKELHRVVKVRAGRAELENGDVYKLEKLMKVKRQAV